MFGYKIDVREDKPAARRLELAEPGSQQGAAQASSIPARIPAITLGSFTDKELPYQVYPAQLDGYDDKPYWLPMYFAAWTGKSMVLPDEEAADIYQHGTPNREPEINVDGPPQNKLNTLYEPSGLATSLRYGDALRVPHSPRRPERRRPRT